MGSAWCSDSDKTNSSLPPSQAASNLGDIDEEDQIEIPANYYSFSDLEKFKWASRVEELPFLKEIMLSD